MKCKATLKEISTLSILQKLQMAVAYS